MPCWASSRRKHEFPGREAHPTMTRVAVAGLFHETHTFLEGRTEAAEFTLREGAALLEADGDGSPLDGFLEVAASEAWTVVPLLDLRATPGPTVADSVVDDYLARFDGALRLAAREGIDAAFLVLHGAMASETQRDVEGALVRRLRSIRGLRDLPVFVVYDLHANVSRAMVEGVTGLVAYKENPHIDARDAAVAAAGTLARYLRERPVLRSFHASVPILWPPTGTGTASSPMRELEDAARALEADEPGVWAVNVAPGFSFADTPDAGLSFTLVGTVAPDVARAHLDALRARAWRLRSAGSVRDEPVGEALARLLPVRRGPVVIAEPADNIGGGAPGDGTGLLRALLDRGVTSALVVLNDPAAVGALQRVAPRATVELALGGKGSRLDPGPVSLAVELVSRSDGRFELEDPRSHLASMTGRRVDMGPCAVVRARGVTLLLTSRKTPPFDLGQLRSQGLVPESFDVIGVKAAVAHRRAYDRIAVAHASVDTAGPCPSDLGRLPYVHVRRPIYPLDPMPDALPEPHGASGARTGAGGKGTA